MLKELHDHMVGELHQNARTDTVFVVAAVLLNLVALGINWGVAASHEQAENAGMTDTILGLMICSTLAINTFACRALIAGRSTRLKLVGGLMAMYRDNDVAKYYDEGLLAFYRARYTLFISVLSVLGTIAIVVPLIARGMG